MLKVKVNAVEILKRDYFPGLISNSNSLLYQLKTKLLCNTYLGKV